eukprot:15370379-Alexandrium_andersonii.AAC.1
MFLHTLSWPNRARESLSEAAHHRSSELQPRARLVLRLACVFRGPSLWPSRDTAAVAASRDTARAASRHLGLGHTWA